jgi:ABC-type multidrug transport system ATPase subunit
MRVSARGVSKRFGRVVALRDVSFELPVGRRVALVGPNGSGKSTLNRVLMGLLACEGDVTIGGRSPLRERVAIAQRMAYVPQQAPALAAPVREVVAAIERARRLAPGSVESLAARLDLDVAGIAGRPFRALSGGMRQKLAISLALAARASLLILDEPTGSLDAAARERFFEIVDGLAPETSVVLCSHRLEEIRPLVTHVLYLDEGRLAYDGGAREFLDLCTTSQLEVRAEGAAAEEWLRARGFRRAGGGVWIKSATHAEKMKLLPELYAGLGPALRNVVARDQESLDLAGVERSRGDG